MKVLIIKMSSLGDIIHTFPALTDAGGEIEDIQFDWMVEESFQELPKWHPLVNNVFTVALRRWRKHPLKTLFNNELINVIKQIRKERYDYIIDAQGLLKSGIASFLCRGVRASYNSKSSKESWANFIYQKKYDVNRNQHAVERVRDLFAKVLNYSIKNSTPNYGIHIDNIFLKNKNSVHQTPQKKYMIFLPNTTWDTKHWPEKYWESLIHYAVKSGWDVELPWGNEKEKSRAKRLAALSEHQNFDPTQFDQANLGEVRVLPRMSLTEVAGRIAGAKAVVALDTGLAHVSAALSIPTVSLYGPTNPGLTGALGLNQKHLKASYHCAPCFKRNCLHPEEQKVNPPCFSTLPPDLVWDELQALLYSDHTQSKIECSV